MKDEYCYFDGKVKRCKNFVTLTASTYHPLLKRPERSFLSSWVDWWHSRRQFIFRAFSPNEAAPRMNQAEVIHASWSHRDRSNLSLLDAAQADVRDSVMLEAELKAFKGTQKVGVAQAMENEGKRVTNKRSHVLLSWAKRCQS